MLTYAELDARGRRLRPQAGRAGRGRGRPRGHDARARPRLLRAAARAATPRRRARAAGPARRRPTVAGLWSRDALPDGPEAAVERLRTEVGSRRVSTVHPHLGHHRRAQGRCDLTFGNHLGRARRLARRPSASSPATAGSAPCRSTTSAAWRSSSAAAINATTAVVHERFDVGARAGDAGVAVRSRSSSLVPTMLAPPARRRASSAAPGLRAIAARRRPGPARAARLGGRAPACRSCRPTG